MLYAVNKTLYIIKIHFLHKTLSLQNKLNNWPSWSRHRIPFQLQNLHLLLPQHETVWPWHEQLTDGSEFPKLEQLPVESDESINRISLKSNMRQHYNYKLIINVHILNILKKTCDTITKSSNLLLPCLCALCLGNADENTPQQWPQKLLCSVLAWCSWRCGYTFSWTSYLQSCPLKI